MLSTGSGIREGSRRQRQEGKVFMGLRFCVIHPTVNVQDSKLMLG